MRPIRVSSSRSWWSSGHDVPVIVLIGDDATLLCDGNEKCEQVIPVRYHELKALAHLAFGVQLTLMANGTGVASQS